MIQYNVTVIIEPEVHERWVHWMKSEHIPQVLATGCFIESKISRLLSPEDGNITYSIQYLCKDMATYEKYRDAFAPALQQDHKEKFEGKFVAFRTLLRVEQQTVC